MFGTTQEVPKYLFDSWELKTETISENKKGLKLFLRHRNMVNFLITPEDIIGCKRIKIEFVDPTGVVSNYYDMTVESDNFRVKGDYSDDSLLTHESTYWVKDLISLVDDKTLENYKKRKEKETSNK
jgi:hypothetical protein